MVITLQGTRITVPVQVRLFRTPMDAAAIDIISNNNSKRSVAVPAVLKLARP
jgi:hypothetical protein